MIGLIQFVFRIAQTALCAADDTDGVWITKWLIKQADILLCSVSENACMFEEESQAFMCVCVCEVAQLRWLFFSSVLHGFASHWQSLSAKEDPLF